MRAWWHLQSRECLEKSIETMKLLGQEDSPAYFALTGASMRDVAQEKIGLR